MSRKDHFAFIDPANIWFTHARIRPYFSGCGQRVEDTLNQLVNKNISIDDIPFITVIENNGNYFSLNNRRLYVLKNLRARGLLEHNVVQVRVKQALEREKDRYIPEKCSLSASLMNERTTDEGGVNLEVASIVIDDAAAPKIESSCSGADEKVEAIVESSSSKKQSQNSKLLPKQVLKELPSLSHQVENGKQKKVLDAVNNWLRNGVISEDQKQLILDEIGLVK